MSQWPPVSLAGIKKQTREEEIAARQEGIRVAKLKAKLMWGNCI